MFWNVGTIQPEEVKLLLECVRCQTRVATTLSGAWLTESEQKQRCVKCTQILAARLRPCFMHEGSDALGFVDTVECGVADILAVSVKVGAFFLLVFFLFAYIL